jgi:drug/metabolite transporter (DMT)-like permease
MMALVYAIAIAVVAQVFIYAGLTFMAGKLFPSFLTPLYHLIPGGNYRFVVSSLTVILVGNYLFQRLYSLQPVLNATIISVTVGICIASVGGLLIEQKSPSILMMLGLSLVILGAVVSVYARSQL